MKITLPVVYRMRQCGLNTVPQSTPVTWRLSVKSSLEKPRYIIIGFQTGKDGDQDANPSLFDNVDTMYVMLNRNRFQRFLPGEIYNAVHDRWTRRV